MNITNIVLENTGGNCMVLYVEVENLVNVKTIGLNDECICLYSHSLADVQDGEIEHTYINYLDSEYPFTLLGEYIGSMNALKIQEIFLNRY
jgi:hypothetical protein